MGGVAGLGEELLTRLGEVLAFVSLFDWCVRNRPAPAPPRRVFCCREEEASMNGATSLTGLMGNLRFILAWKTWAVLIVFEAGVAVGFALVHLSP